MNLKKQIWSNNKQSEQWPQQCKALRMAQQGPLQPTQELSCDWQMHRQCSHAHTPSKGLQRDMQKTTAQHKKLRTCKTMPDNGLAGIHSIEGFDGLVHRLVHIIGALSNESWQAESWLEDLRLAGRNHTIFHWIQHQAVPSILNELLEERLALRNLPQLAAVCVVPVHEALDNKVIRFRISIATGINKALCGSEHLPDLGVIMIHCELEEKGLAVQGHHGVRRHHPRPGPGWQIGFLIWTGIWTSAEPEIWNMKLPGYSEASAQAQTEVQQCRSIWNREVVSRICMCMCTCVCMFKLLYMYFACMWTCTAAWTGTCDGLPSAGEGLSKHVNDRHFKAQDLHHRRTCKAKLRTARTQSISLEAVSCTHTRTHTHSQLTHLANNCKRDMCKTTAPHNKHELAKNLIMNLKKQIWTMQSQEPNINKQIW